MLFLYSVLVKIECWICASVTALSHFINSTTNGFWSKFQLFFGTDISQTRRLHIRNLYLFSKPNSYSCGRALQGELSKFTWRNTATAFKTMIESHKDLKGTEVFARICSTKSWPERFHKMYSKETVIKFFLTWVATLLKKIFVIVIFIWLLQIFFRITVFWTICNQLHLKERKGHTS